MSEDSARNMNSGGAVRVICGPNEETFPGLIGRSINNVRQNLRIPFAIDPTAQARLSNPVTRETGVLITEENRLLRAGDTLEFVRPTGQKGVQQPSLEECYKSGKKLITFFNAGRTLLQVLRMALHA